MTSSGQGRAEGGSAGAASAGPPRASVGVVTGERLGRLSLRWDAIYCTVLGIGVTVGSAWLAPLLGLSAALVTVLGLAVVAWAVLLTWLTSRLRLRTALRLVLLANVLAAAGIAASSVVVTSLLVGVVVATVAADVAAFAVSQAVAMGRLPASAPA